MHRRSGHWRLALRGVALAALAALASCGGSSDGVALAPVADGTPAPCAAAFDPPGAGVGTPNDTPHGSVSVASSIAFDGKAFANGARSVGDKVAGMLINAAHADDLPLTRLTTPLSSCQRDAQNNVTIGGDGGCGPNVVIDRSFTARDGNALGKITIAAGGKLAVPRLIDRTLELETTGISVAGTLSLGTASCPVGGPSDPRGRVKVTFTGNLDADKDHGSGAGNGSGADKGIEVGQGGTLRLYGAKGVGAHGVNWTYLSRPAGPAKYQTADDNIGAPVDAGGEKRLYLAQDVVAGGWAQDDWIVVATSSFSPFESEFVQIESVEKAAGGGSVVTLRQPLRHYHYGSADPGVPGEDNYGKEGAPNYGVDERTEVGLISRAVTLTASTPSDRSDPYLHWGGEIRILAGFGEVGIQGVELEKFGKARLGSYPVHFHMAGDASNPDRAQNPNAARRHLIDSNSIHHSYNKCVTVHMTQGVSVTNNVCARAVGHLFYQELAQEQKGEFVGNLGVGAQSHYFGIESKLVGPDGMVKGWWEGDNLARANGYDSLNVPNKDAQDNPMRGKCFAPEPDGLLRASSDAPCKNATDMYVEPASGFWIGNPGTKLVGNSIAGCQGTGKGYWYVPPENGPVKNEPLGRFFNNRVHACYDGLFGEENNTKTGQLFPTVPGNPFAKNVVGRFEGLTATRIRNRGVWVRPVWYSVENSRFATNRDSVTLVTSGGVDGNAPGVWALLKDSVLVGVSKNNVDRWGPCAADEPLQKYGKGCVDFNRKSNEQMDHGYQTPFWNSAGYMIYDGPVRILRNHFVNFLADTSSLLTRTDNALIATAYFERGLKVYEGDAALGWFQTNQSAYPTSTVTKELTYDNVDLRHQIYTEYVNVADFRDGDKNTAVIDLDGTLTGFRIVDANGVPVPDEFPISLNNLPFNRNGNAVDECRSTGAQDKVQEGRPTSMISPANMATLDFEALALPERGSIHWQDMLFSKDSLDGSAHRTMQLQSRNGLGVWEPKVASGASYSVQPRPGTVPGYLNKFFGVPRTVQVGLTDAVKSGISAANPFYVRVGIRYAGAGGLPPSSGGFTVERGYKSWGGNGVETSDPDLWPYFNYYDGNLGRPNCFNLDAQNPTNLNAGNCPAQGQIPGGQTFPTEVFQPVSAMSDLSRPDGTPVATNKYFYDSAAGMLYFYVTQTTPNAKGPTPLGSCKDNADPTCPGEGELETYYPCPPQGCTTVKVTVDNPAYVPAACDANCVSSPDFSFYGPGGLAGTTGHTVSPPVIANRLAYVDRTGPSAIVVPQEATATTANGSFTHWTSDEPWCPIRQLPAARAKVASATSPRHEVFAQLRADLQARARALQQFGTRVADGARNAATGRGGEWFSSPRPVPVIDPMAQICTVAQDGPRRQAAWVAAGTF